MEIKSKLERLDSWTYLDLGIFRNTKLTVFEALIKYLKDEKGLSFKEISLVLDRDERNVWTVYNRGCRKASSSWPRHAVADWPRHAVADWPSTKLKTSGNLKKLASGREQEKRRRKLN